MKLKTKLIKQNSSNEIENKIHQTELKTNSNEMENKNPNSRTWLNRSCISGFGPLKQLTLKITLLFW
jgi:hypothetical protein